MNPSGPFQQSIRNRVLAEIPGEEFQKVKNHLLPVRLVLEQVLIEHRHKTEHVFFIEEGIVSMIAGSGRPSPTFQVAMIGPEGMVGCQAMLGNNAESFTLAVVQTPGLAHRMSVNDMERLLPVCPTFRSLCMGAVEALMDQSMQTSAFGASNKLAERCVRWLLMAHDRSQGDDLIVTHEIMSSLLGVRRSGVTVVASMLQEAGLVRVGRGRITILNRPGLEGMMPGRSWTVEPASSSQAWQKTAPTPMETAWAVGRRNLA